MAEEKKEIKLSKKDKLKIIRDIMVKKPDHKKWGFNKIIIDYFMKKYGIKLDKGYCSRLIQEVKENWKAIRDNYVTFNQILDYWLDLLDNTNDEGIKVKCLSEMGKLCNHYEENINLNARIRDDINLSKLNDEELRSFKILYDKVINKSDNND